MAHLPAMVGLDIPNFLPEFARPAGRLIWFSLMLFVGTAAIVVWMKRGPYLRRAFARSRVLRTVFPGLREDAAGETTWAGAVAGSVLVFWLMILAYGVVPHEWLTYSDAHLNWGTDSFFIEGSAIVPFDVNRQAVRDIIVIGIYGVFLVVNVWLFSAWQKRVRTIPEEDAAEDATPTERGTSAYGRPVTTRS